MSKFIKKVFAAGVVATGLTFGASSAQANGYESECCHYKKVTSYDCVISYECRKEAYQKEVTKYDHCGKAYCEYVTCYRTVEVPVKKYVPVVKWVKVCD